MRTGPPRGQVEAAPIAQFALLTGDLRDFELRYACSDRLNEDSFVKLDARVAG